MSRSTEASRVTASSGALERKTVRSGFAYDINGVRGSAESSERARRLKEELGSVPVTGIEDRVAYRFVKRVFDIVFSAAVLVAFCWLFAIIAILIKVDDPKGPVFFSQERVGKDGRTFRMLKFRSMCVDAEDRLAELRELNEKTGPVFKIAEDPRITRVGKWLRKLSLDELPQFINVLRSDMSIVGPRPALPAEVATYDDYQRQRLLVKPGLTCSWQTRRNRDSIAFDEWVDLDLWREKVSMRSMRVDDSCPYCKNRKLLRGFNDLATTYPGIAAMWHPRMSKRLKPTGVQAISRKPAWWRGECGHVYQMAVRDRARAKPGYCPYCSGRKRPERPIRLD